MPLVRITLRRGQSDGFIQSVCDAVHESLVSAAAVPADDRFQIVDEVESSRLIAHPNYGGVDRSERLVIVEITLNVGRTVEVKRALYQQIAERLAAATDLRSDDLLIALTEVTKENWSFGGGRATYA